MAGSRKIKKGVNMSNEDMVVLNEANDLLREYREKKNADKNLLIKFLNVWNKLKKIECSPAPFSSEQIGECEIEAIRGQVAVIILQKATKIAF